MQTLILRQRNQITLPPPLVKWLGVKQGDPLQVVPQKNGDVVIKSNQARQARAAAALAKIQEGIAASGIPLEELLAEADRVGKEIVAERYPSLAK